MMKPLFNDIEQDLNRQSEIRKNCKILAEIEANSFTSNVILKRVRFSNLPTVLQYYIFNRVAAASFAYLMASTMHFFKSAKFFRPHSLRAEASQLLWPLVAQWF